MFARILTFKASNCKSLQIWWKPRVFVPTGTSTSHWSWMFFHSSKQTSGSWDHPLTLADPEAERMRHSFISDTQQTAGSSLSEGYLKLNSLKLTRKNCKNNEEITKLYTVAPVQLSWMLCSKAEWSDMIFNDCKINNWVSTGWNLFRCCVIHTGQKYRNRKYKQMSLAPWPLSLYLPTDSSTLTGWWGAVELTVLDRNWTAGSAEASICICVYV